MINEKGDESPTPDFPRVVSFIMANVVELSIPKSSSKIPVNTGLFINNEFVPSVDKLDPIK